VDVFINAEEVAEMLKLSLMTIRRYTMNKQIPFHKINRAVRYDKAEIEEWVRKGGIAKQNEKNVTPETDNGVM
jgi:excisionase family DNA binding protein